MKSLISRFHQIILLVAIVALTGCATGQQEYQGAFNSQSALTNNQKTFQQPSDAIFKITKQVFIQQGFTIENADTKSGIIKAVRNLQDQSDPEISYSIHTSADISELGNETSVSLSASQQTILHRQTTTWWHLLWIIPIIPTGTEYQTLVIKEGNITDPVFYTDFFNALSVSVAKYDQAVKLAAAKAAAKAEQERRAVERAAAEKLAAEKAAAAKVAAEKAELERIEAEKAAKLKAEADAKALEDKNKADKLATVKAEAARAAAVAKKNKRRI